MIGYIFETTNKKTGEKYLGKRYAVSFDKNFLGDMDDLAVAIEKYGKPTFEVKMLRPCETIAQLDTIFEQIKAERKPTGKVVVTEEEVKSAPRKKRSKAVEE